MRVIQVRGANASGKSTVVRQFIQRYSTKEEKIPEINQYITRVDEVGLIVLGRYVQGGNFGGVDHYGNKNQVLYAINYVKKKYNPKFLVFEGLIYSTTFKFAYLLSEKLAKQGDSYLALLLKREYNQTIELMVLRNGGNPVNVERVIEKMIQIDRSFEKLISSGVAGVQVDTGKIPLSEMGDILGREILGR